MVRWTWRLRMRVYFHGTDPRFQFFEFFFFELLFFDVLCAECGLSIGKSACRRDYGSFTNRTTSCRVFFRSFA